jgi:hypothetical protein
MIGPMLLQPSIGRVLDREWSGQLYNSLRVYSVEAFQLAFLLIVGWSALACLLMAMTRETYCKPAA